MMPFPVFRPSLTLAAVVIGAAPLAGQAITTAAVQGVVRGQDSVGLAEAIVTVTNTANGERWRTTTTAAGRYVVEHLSLGGPYTVQAIAIGYASAGRAGIQLSLGERRRVDITLAPVVIELPELAVAGHAHPVLNPGRTGPAQLIPEEQVTGLPVEGRDFSQLTLLSPQVILTPDRGFSIAGQSDRLNNFQIDGTTNNDLEGLSGTFGSGVVGGQTGARTVSVEAIQELQVLTAPFDVRYGMFAGGLVNVVTRSGSNRWEGSVSSYYQDEGLAGHDAAGRRPGGFSDREVTLTLGGPLVRDRVALFLDAGVQRYSGGRQRGIGTDTTGGADSVGFGIRRATAVRFQDILRNDYGVDAGSIRPSQFRNDGENLLAKVTIWPALNQRLELSHNYARRGPEIPEGYDGVIYNLTSYDWADPGTVNATRLTWTAAGRGRFSNDFAISRVEGTEDNEPRGRFAEVLVSADDGVLRAGANRIFSNRSARHVTWELNDNASWMLGSHRMTVGTHDELISLDGKNRSTFLTTGTWSFRSLDSLENRQPISFRRTVPGPGRTEGARSDFLVRQFGLYLQDQWTPAANLVLTAGLRLDVPFLPEAPPRNTALFNGLGINTAATPSGHSLWSPRLGFNYDVGGRGARFLRGGVGLFSGRPIYLYFSNVYETTGLETLFLDCRGAADVPVLVSFDPADQPTACASTAAPATPVVSAFAPSFKFPRNLRLSLGADVQLPWKTVASMDLLYIRGLDQLDVIDANLAPPSATSAGEGRLLYGAVDPNTGDAFPNRLDGGFDRVSVLRNSSGDRTWSASLQLRSQIGRRIRLDLGYTWTDARDRMSPIGADLPGNLDATPVDGSLERRRVSTSSFEAVHKVTAGATVMFPLGFRLGVFYNGFSGTPLTYVVEGDPNADGIGINDAVYVPRNAGDITLADPTQWAALDRFIRAEPCLARQRGRIMRRNSCRDHWHTLLNARVSKEFATRRGQSIEVIADLFNVLSFFDRDWGVQYRHEGQRLLGLVGYDPANDRGIYDMLRIDRAVRNDDATRWRVQLGGRYRF